MADQMGQPLRRQSPMELALFESRFVIGDHSMHSVVAPRKHAAVLRVAECVARFRRVTQTGRQ